MHLLEKSLDSEVSEIQVDPFRDWKSYNSIESLLEFHLLDVILWTKLHVVRKSLQNIYLLTAQILLSLKIKKILLRLVNVRFVQKLAQLLRFHKILRQLAQLLNHLLRLQQPHLLTLLRRLTLVTRNLLLLQILAFRLRLLQKFQILHRLIYQSVVYVQTQNSLREIFYRQLQSQRPVIATDIQNLLVQKILVVQQPDSRVTPSLLVPIIVVVRVISELKFSTLPHQSHTLFLNHFHYFLVPVFFLTLHHNYLLRLSRVKYLVFSDLLHPLQRDHSFSLQLILLIHSEFADLALRFSNSKINENNFNIGF